MLSTAVLGGIGGGGGGGGALATDVGSTVGSGATLADVVGAAVTEGAAVVTGGGGALIGSVAGPHPAATKPVKRHPSRIGEERVTGGGIYLK